jgi:hypothetical protein
MKKVISILALALAMAAIFAPWAHADAPQITIVEFARINNSVLAEVCGNVKQTLANHIDLVVTTDYANNPRTYHTFTELNGNFCEVVVTLYGTVQVSLENDSTGVVPALATLKKTTKGK